MQKLDITTFDILQGWIEGNHPTIEEQEALIEQELNSHHRAKAFGITADNCQQSIEARSQLFSFVQQRVLDWCEAEGIEKNRNEILHLLWTFWLPLAINLAEARQELGRPPIQGILGGQGTGKSSLARILSLLLKSLGYNTATISIDDLYKTHAERQQLLAADPRLIWRGPPGTHDVALGVQVLERCLEMNNSEPILLPRFDKSAHNGSGDRISPQMIPSADIILFEGWFVGARPLSDEIIEHSQTTKDILATPADIEFAKDVNRRLIEYLPLWDKLDRLLVLYPADYRLSKQWRREAEHKMIAQGKAGMSDSQIDKFVEYFWKSLHPDLYIKPLVINPYLVDLVVEIKSDRSYGNIYKPSP